MSEIPSEEWRYLAVTPDYESSGESFGQSWDDIFLPDGKRLEWITNLGMVTTETEVFVINDRRLWESTARLGLTSIPEIEAKDSIGNVLNDAFAVYVDSRIGRDTVYQVTGCIDRIAPDLFGVDNVARLAKPEELDELVARAIRSLGLEEKIAACQQSDTPRQIGKTATQEPTYDTGLLS
jgi:hypothetical protein